MDDPDYRLTLRPLKGDAPPQTRLKGLLKMALRAFRFRCIAVEEVQADNSEGTGATPDVGRPGMAPPHAPVSGEEI